ncbi:hypothetical protein AOE01nite_14000 [Acetobacter oeni]|uniref:Lipoprotein n=1 Tax=Acetobacter oeni TaxID=304077 RepID=A0A511XJR1_9PROT|nr:hypothetical protein [Acetobacter oeni]GEN63176.1 hypothetical protein AOE01nite_14000 [Acetobacter oeni]
MSVFFKILAGLGVISVAACATTSDVMDRGNGVYSISGYASHLRGGATGAINVAYRDAQAFCAKTNPGAHAIVLNESTRDVYQSSGSFSSTQGNASGSYGKFASGNADLIFRCG